MEKNVHLIQHPLIQHKLTLMRDRTTSTKEFRELVKEVSALMVYEISRNMSLKETDIETPIEKTKGKLLKDEVAIIPILRAGITMADGIIDLIPTAKVGHVGLYRDPDTLEPVEYYCKLPKHVERYKVFLVDPMLATGGSAVKAIQVIKEKGAKNISFVCLISAPEGLDRLSKAFPEISIYTISIDKYLNSHGYIVPGLGDAGDRLFGTK
ncbi:MAG: uracil phosphoribosyltransferase [Nitrospiraceae bacterium]|nr:uracil phosphoribosyltransferase [Nitrospiraceae bacterium]